MSFSAAESKVAGDRGPWVVVGYGNAARRDDGLGPYVVAGLRRKLGNDGRCRWLTRHQLEPDLVDDLRDAGKVILIDAAVDRFPGGVRWERVEPRPHDPPRLTHSLTPWFLLGLLDLVHGRRPPTWLVSIQGDDFDHGEGLSPEARERAERAVSAVAAFLTAGPRSGMKAPAPRPAHSPLSRPRRSKNGRSTEYSGH